MKPRVFRDLTPAQVAAVDPRAFWIRATPRSYGCWEWFGPRGGDTYAYGRLRVNGRITGAHRVAWVMANDKPVSWPHEVLHHCDNGRCVNPAHLYLGIQANNVADRVRRNRGGVGSFIPVGDIAA